MLNNMDFELQLAKRMIQNSFFGDYCGENIEKMGVKTTKELIGKVYGDYNALAINMGCDCDPTTKKVVLQDWLNQNIYEEEEKK